MATKKKAHRGIYIKPDNETQDRVAEFGVDFKKIWPGFKATPPELYLALVHKGLQAHREECREQELMAEPPPLPPRKHPAPPSRPTPKESKDE
jgi:hypothetical protein